MSPVTKLLFFHGKVFRYFFFFTGDTLHSRQGIKIKIKHCEQVQDCRIVNIVKKRKRKQISLWERFPFGLVYHIYLERFLTMLSHCSAQAQICPPKSKCIYSHEIHTKINNTLSIVVFFFLWQIRCNLQVIKWCCRLNILLSMKQNLLIAKQVRESHHSIVSVAMQWWQSQHF